MKDDINKRMKYGEIALSVFVDFSKAFNTVDFNILIQKVLKLHFCKTFSHLLDYLSIIYLVCVQILLYRKGQFWDQYFL